MRRIFWIFICFLTCSMLAFGQQGHDHSGHDHNHDHSGHNHSNDHNHDDHGHDHHGDVGACQIPHKDPNVFEPGKTAFHHIADQNVYSIGPLQIPLPCIIYNHGGGGVDVFSSGKFHADYHGVGEWAYKGFVMYDGIVRKVRDASFPKEHVELGHHRVYAKEVEEGGKVKDIVHVCYNGQEYACDNKSTLDGGLLGGGITSFTDFSVTKNVVTMLIVFLFLAWMLTSVAKAYKTRRGQAPKGMQGLIETIFVFIQDEVAKPFLGHKWEKFLPILMSLFFFILGLNLFGQVPFFGGSNVTGNLGFTLALAVIAFLVTNLNGNSHYWGHVFNMPGVPALLKIFIITPVEIMGLFIKPLTLMLRLFGNMTAGHMVIVIFVGLIFIFGGNGTNVAAGSGMVIGSALLTLFMMAIELLVAFIQAFVFTILTASYIGAATEEAHHH